MIVWLVLTFALVWALVFFVLKLAVFSAISEVTSTRRSLETLIAMIIVFGILSSTAAAIGAGVAAFAHRVPEEGAMYGIGVLAFVLGFACLRGLWMEWQHEGSFVLRIAPTGE